MDLIEQLGKVTTRNESGMHFTQWLDYEELEDKGLVKVYRPVHETGIPYSQEYWTIEVTEKGLNLLEIE